MDERDLAWLRIGRATLPESIKRVVLQHFPDPLEALSADLSVLPRQNRLGSGVRLTLGGRSNERLVAQDAKWLASEGHSVIGLTDPKFPSLLGEISCPPVVLYCKGDESLLQGPALAIVGSRNPTPAGVETAHDFASELAAIGIVVVSGLALGIDSAAHRGALKARGPTIAACATGLDIVYPRCHHDLAHQISEGGLVVSEFVLGTGVRRHHFPQRNRLISGLSLGTLIVEAAPGSGSLITAGFAADQGREVFAVPGSINSPLSRGVHQLIRDGAQLVESTRQIVEHLSLSNEVQEIVKPAGKQPYWCTLDLDTVDFAPTSVNRVAERSGLTISEVCAMLIRMELAGLVRSCAGGYLRLR